MIINKETYRMIQQLSRKLRLKYGLPPNRPSVEEVILIVNDLSQIPEKLRSEKVWKESVYKHVHFEGQYLYKGLDFSDINLLLNILGGE